MTFSIEEIIWVAIYLRVSTGRQAQEGYSLDGQLEACIKLAREKYGPNVRWEVYADEGISGKDLSHRRQLLGMLHDVQSGKFTAVITLKVSRLSRNLANALNVVTEIVGTNTHFVSVKEGDYDSFNDRLKLNLLAAVAEYQREELAENVQLGMSQRASEGKWNGGKVLGCRSNKKDSLIVIPEEATIVKLIFQKVDEERWGGKKLVNFLNQQGYRTKKGNLFSMSGIHDILRNPVYKGYIRFTQTIDLGGTGNRRRKTDEPILIQGTPEPIASAEMWDRVQTILNSRSTGTPRQYSGTFPLTGIVRCPECGAYMTSMYGSRRKNGSKARYYVCGNYHNKGASVCSSNTVRAERLEQGVWDRLAEALSSELILDSLVTNVNEQVDQYNRREPPDDGKNLVRRLENLKAQKEKIHQGYEADLYTMAEATEKLKPIREAIAEAEHELNSLQNPAQSEVERELAYVTPDLLKGQLRDFLGLKETLDVHEFRQLLRATVKKIEVQNKALSKVHFSFVVCDSNGDSTESDSESDPEDPLHIQNQNPILLRALPSHAQKRHLSMVRFAECNPDRRAA